MVESTENDFVDDNAAVKEESADVHKEKRKSENESKPRPDSSSESVDDSSSLSVMNLKSKISEGIQ